MERKLENNLENEYLRTDFCEFYLDLKEWNFQRQESVNSFIHKIKLKLIKIFNHTNFAQESQFGTS